MPVTIREDENMKHAQQGGTDRPQANPVQAPIGCASLNSGTRTKRRTRKGLAVRPSRLRHTFPDIAAALDAFFDDEPSPACPTHVRQDPAPRSAEPDPERANQS